MFEQLMKALSVFWSVFRGKPVTFLQLQSVLDTMKDTPEAKIGHTTKSHRTVDFRVKMYRPKSARKQARNKWGI